MKGAEQVEASPRSRFRWTEEAWKVRVAWRPANVAIGKQHAVDAIPTVRPIEGGTGQDAIGHEPGGGRKAGAGAVSEFHPRHVNRQKEGVVVGIAQAGDRDVGERQIHKNVIPEAGFKLLPAWADIRVGEFKTVELGVRRRRDGDTGPIVPLRAAGGGEVRILNDNLEAAACRGYTAQT